MEEAKKNLLTYAGLRKLEDELHDLKVVKRKEVAGKIKEAREQGDLSENAEYDAAKDEQRDIEARIEEIEKILKISGSGKRHISPQLYAGAGGQARRPLRHPGGGYSGRLPPVSAPGRRRLPPQIPGDKRLEPSAACRPCKGHRS